MIDVHSLTMATILFKQFFLPLESAKLGRFIVSIEHPHQEYHDPACPDAPEGLVSVRDDYHGSSQENAGNKFALALTSLMSAGFSNRAKTNVKIAADQVKTYTLANSTRWFMEAMSLEDTRKWVERAIYQDDDVYLIVGFHTVFNARIIQESVRGRETAGEISLPVGLSLAAVGVIAPFGNIVDPKISGSHQAAEGGRVQFVAPGEQVCAFQYRKICYRWFSSRNVDNAVLSKWPRWTTYDRSRDRDEEGGRDDSIEVELVELQADGGDWDREEASTGEILLLRS
jgi:hypothetical protein